MLGAGLEIWALLGLGWRRALDLTAEPPQAGLPRLVLGGPFRCVRHPQSLGLLLLLGGAALATRSPGTWLAAGLAGALVMAMAIRHDRELAREFGAAYARYRAAVPLLMPRLR
jgi:protein-S-isoprenylcysteine O-methyltransferase Ste14